MRIQRERERERETSSFELSTLGLSTERETELTDKLPKRDLNLAARQRGRETEYKFH